MVLVIKRYSWILHLVTIAISCFLVAQAIATFVASLPGGVALSPSAEGALSEEKQGEETEEAPGVLDYSVITERNLFNSQASGLEAVPPEDMTGQILTEGGPAVKSSLDLKILGMLVFGEGTDRRSSVAVGGGKGKSGGDEVFYVGDEKSFAPNVRLTKVMKDRIEFINNGRLEYAELSLESGRKSIFESADKVHGEKKQGGVADTAEGKPPADIVAKEGGVTVIDQAAIDDALSNLDRFYTEVRIVPHFKEGRVAGMKVLSVKAGSIISKLGIKRGDILEKINGQELDVKRGMALFSELKDQKSFSIDVMRGGKQTTLEYEIR
ncbi:MAG: hypothetical protein HY542_01780 [Deltaproteobacteria bacterium]|nr:hypothetical protein [Deltaproteobacteria bacterium]